jgi:thiamine-monophosphate kinase
MPGLRVRIQPGLSSMNQTAAESGEDRLIARHFRPLVQHPGAFQLEDDAASITPPPGCDLVLTTDAIVAGVHFFPDDPPAAIGNKALRVNISDLAAKGAQPLGFLLALALPADVSEAWLAEFAHGLRADADAFECPLLGGDTVRTPGPITICITAIGTVRHGQMVRRTGSMPGDQVVVTGTIGDAALGLLLRKDATCGERLRLSPAQQNEVAARYLRPQPRVAIADLLATHASAAMDVSDGLVGDLAKLCRASKLAAEIEIARVPLSDAARAAVAADPSLLETIVTGGDDYEILATVPGTQLEALRQAAQLRGVAVTAVGTITADRGEPRLLDAAGKPMAFVRPSFSHF